MRSGNVAESKPVQNDNNQSELKYNAIKLSDGNIKEQAFQMDGNTIGDRNVKKEERVNDGHGLVEKTRDMVELAKASKGFLYYLNKLNLIRWFVCWYRRHREKKKETAQSVLKETKEAGEDIRAAQEELKDADKVVDEAKEDVKDVAIKVRVWMDVNKKLYDKAVDDNEKLRNDIQQQIKKLEDNEKSRQETNDGLIKEFDGFIDQTQEEFKALENALDELDCLLKEFNEGNEDDKQSHFEKIQEKQTALINKFNGLQEKQLKFLTEFREKLYNACEVITQQNKNLIEELRKIAESNEDHDTVLKQTEEEYYSAKQKYEKTKKDHESWMPAIGWTRPTEQDVKNAEQEFLRKAAKLNILKGIDDNDIQNGLRSIIEDLDEIKQHQEHAIKDLNDARGHLDSVMKTVNKARELTAIFSFDFDLNSTPVKAGLIGGVVGGGVAIAAGCSTLPVIVAAASCGFAAVLLGKVIDMLHSEGNENSDILSGDDEKIDDDDDLDLLPYDIREDSIEEDVSSQSQKIEGSKKDSDAKHTNISEKSADNVGVNDDVGNVVEFDDDDLDFLPQGFDQAVIDESVMASAREIANLQSTNESDNSNDNVGVFGAIGDAVVNLGKGAVNAAVGVGKGVVNVVANVGGAAVKAGTTVIGGCIGFVSKLWPFGKGKQSNGDE